MARPGEILFLHGVAGGPEGLRTPGYTRDPEPGPSGDQELGARQGGGTATPLPPARPGVQAKPPAWGYQVCQGRILTNNGLMYSEWSGNVTSLLAISRSIS